MRCPRLRLPVPRKVHALRSHPKSRRTVLLLRRSVREFREDHCPQLAAAVSYHLLFSIFPLAIVGVGVVGLVTDSPQARDSVADTVTRFVPLSSDGQEKLHAMLRSLNGSAGALGLLGLLGVLWSASGVMAAVRTAINVAWDAPQRRSFLRGKGVDLLVLLGAFVLVTAAMGVAVLVGLTRRGGAAVSGWLGLLVGPLAATFAVLATLCLLSATFLALYRLLPAVPTRTREVWPGAVVAAVGVTVLQYGFSIYLAHFSHYNRVYGSLGTVIAFMFFVYMAALIVLFGAEIASELPRLPAHEQAQCDGVHSTRAEPNPSG